MVLWALKGDLDYFAKGLFLWHYVSNAFCEICPAHSDETDPSMIWNNFKANALWKRSLYDVPQWRASHDILHWLFLELPYLSQHNVEPDELHVLHLGTSKYMLGSVLFVLCYKSLKGTPAQNMKKVFLWGCVPSIFCCLL